MLPVFFFFYLKTFQIGAVKIRNLFFFLGWAQGDTNGRVHFRVSVLDRPGGGRGQTVQNQAALYWHKANLQSGWWWWWWWNLLQQPDWCLSQWIWLISLVHRNIKSIYELTEVWQALVKLNPGIETWLAAVEYFILPTKHVEVLFLADSTRGRTFASSHCSSSLNNIT